jgi:uncharacterized protein (TIGR03437 family)
MNRLTALVFLLLLAGAASGQEQVNMRVFTEPAGAGFYVDGRFYSGPATFLWPAGSKHVLNIDTIQTSNIGGRRFSFVNWTDNSQTFTTTNPTIAVTAGAAVTSFKATVTLEYEVSINFFDCSGAACAGSPGTVYVDNSPFLRSGKFWAVPDTQIRLSAVPNDGYVFVGWGGLLSGTAWITTHTVRGPVVISAQFAPGRKVRFRTDPPELEILVDRQLVRSPAELDLARGSKHLLAAPAFQYDQWSNLWVLDSFSTGGGQNSVYTVGDVNIPETIVAKFVPGVRVSFLTDPVNLRLTVDGRENWPGYNFVWPAGSKHTIAAPAEQQDAKGQRFAFRGWSNDGPAAQEITVGEGAAIDGLRLVARYLGLTRLTVQSIPAGMPMRVDGTDCQTPCVIDKPSGTEIQVNATEVVAVSDQTRMEFESWIDGGSPGRTIALGSSSRTIAAKYRPAHRLTAYSDPEGGARIRTEPGSADGFFPDGSEVTLFAESKPGFAFRRWDGDVAGSYRSANMMMSGPRVARALLDRSPYIDPAGVRNAAAELPEPGVAPGSLISIIGASLSLRSEAGPDNPLAQAIAGVSVRVDSRILPLVFVSPEQINAQLPSDLAEGEYTLRVTVTGLPEVAGRFQVVRNAPGLFGNRVDGEVYAAAFHEDGTAISLESQARRGEVVTLLGTGFGPYKLRLPDGFRVPDTGAFALADRVEIAGAGFTLEPEWSGAAGGAIGVTATKIRIGDAVPAGSLEIRARVNGRESNAVRLPVE